MSLVTLSASYGAGGSRIGPALAERLGVPFVDRAIPSAVAERLALPLGDALARDQAVSGVFSRMLQSFAPAIGPFALAPIPEAIPISDQDYCAATEHVIRAHAECGEGVVLGRAGACVLREHPEALHVRLDGPREKRIVQAMRIEHVDRVTAERRMDETDRAREAYVRQLYRTDPRSADLYHLVIDSTAISLDACVELIAQAAHGRAQAQLSA